jgi:hypothetical protein
MSTHLKIPACILELFMVYFQMFLQPSIRENCANLESGSTVNLRCRRHRYKSLSLLLLLKLLLLFWCSITAKM